MVIKAPHWVLAIMATLLAACTDRSPPGIEITTRAGGTFLLVRPVVNYERICSPGSYALQGDPDKRGLRIRADESVGDPELKRPHSSDAGSEKTDAVLWTAIAEIEFAELVGDLGTSAFCGGSPDAVAAKISYRDGRQERRQLIDTTDRGIDGLSDRGRTTVPLRNISRLRTVENRDWDWVKKFPTDPLDEDRAQRGLVLKVTIVDGEYVEAAAAARDQYALCLRQTS